MTMSIMDIMLTRQKSKWTKFHGNEAYYKKKTHETEDSDVSNKLAFKDMWKGEELTKLFKEMQDERLDCVYEAQSIGKTNKH